MYVAHKTLDTKGLILMDILTDFNASFTLLREDFDSRMATGSLTIDMVVEETHELTDRIAREGIRSYVESLDERLRGSETRKKDYTIERRSQQKTLATTAGPVVFERTYFRDKKTNTHVCLADRLLGLEPHQRTSRELACSLLLCARDTSYQKAVDRYAMSGVTSRTTVKNLVHRFGKIESFEAPLPGKKEVVRLYIEADEDHVAMQDGTNQQMKLIYVHEGQRQAGKKRKVLMGVRRFTGLYKGASDELWYEVLDYLSEAYDLEKVEEISLSGDGAGWIRMGESILPKCRLYLDKFHLEKALKKAASPVDALKGTDGTYYWFLKDAISMDAKEDIAVFFDSAEGLPLTVAQHKTLREMRTYLLSNWGSIQNAAQTGYHGCSAEGHVSHVLSARLSSRPMGWSETGAENIARLRVFALNGGNLRGWFAAKDKAKKKEARLARLEKRIVKKSRVYPVKQGSISYATPHFGWYKS